MKVTFKKINFDRITIKKLKSKVIRLRVTWFYGKRFYNLMYVSGWHGMLINAKETGHENYFTAIPNRGAGIGHQMANWIAGYWFAKKLQLNFTHIPFSTPEWESFLGFGSEEVLESDLSKGQGYKRVKLPLFDESKENEVKVIKGIVSSYSGKKVIFIAEQDQFYKDQFGVIDDIKNKYHRASVRLNDDFIFSKNTFNIAIHVRRGDIVVGQDDNNQNLTMRWQNNDYFVNVLSSVIKNLKTKRPISIYLFSQGEIKDFSEFEKFKNINFCLDMGAKNTFAHMVEADLLITSKSSFSYKPALLSNGIKVCPKVFWHGYPNDKNWILADDDGCLDVNALNQLCITQE